jgi:hypothetical protein
MRFGRQSPLYVAPRSMPLPHRRRPWQDTKRDPHCDFARALRHHVGKHAVDADQGEQQRQRSERDEQRHFEAAWGDGVVEAVGQSLRVEERDALGAADAADGADQSGGIGMGAYHDFDTAEGKPGLGDQSEHLGLGRGIEPPAVFGYDAHYGNRSAPVGQPVGHRDAESDGTLARISGHEAAGKCFIDHHDRR